jgi:tetratricopeptide (TPR) repeat protein
MKSGNKVAVLVCAFVSLPIVMMSKEAVKNVKPAAAAKSAAKNVKPQKKAQAVLMAQVDADAQVYGNYFQATYLHANGDNERSLKAFENVIGSRPAAQSLIEPYMQALFDGERFAQIVKLYEDNKKLIDELRAKNYQLTAFLAQGYLVTGSEAKAQELFAVLLREHGNDVQMCYFAAVGYIKTKRYPAAIKFLQQCLANEDIKNKHYLFHFLLSKVYFESGRAQEAMASIERSLEQFPKFDRGWLFKAILLEQQGKINEAIGGYSQFLDIAGPDQSIEKQLVQLLFNQQRYSEAAVYLKKLSTQAPEYAFDLALVQTKSGNYKEALASINKVLGQDPKLEKARLLKIEILLNSNNHADAVITLEEWVMGDPSNMNALRTCLLVRQGGVAAPLLMTALERVLAKHPQSLPVIATLGDIAVSDKLFDKALEYYGQAIALVTNKKLLGKIYFQRCHILLEQKNEAALQAEFAAADAAGCIGHELLNVRAFHAAQNNGDLEKALGAIDLALAIKPGRPSYLDTKALVLFKMGRHAEALHCARQALSLAPNDQIIKKHVEEFEQHAPTPIKQKKGAVRRSR